MVVEGKQPTEHPTPTFYNNKIISCARRGDCAGAEKWLRKMMVEGGHNPNEYSINAVMNAHAKLGMLTRQRSGCIEWHHSILLRTTKHTLHYLALRHRPKVENTTNSVSRLQCMTECARQKSPPPNSTWNALYRTGVPRCIHSGNLQHPNPR